MEKSLNECFDENYARIQSEIIRAAEKSGRDPQEITLLAATKTVSVEVINHAIDSGLQVIGENRVQELLSKYDAFLPVEKHLIGHLQTNKVKDVVGKVTLIHSVDSLKLAAAIQKQAEKLGIVQRVLIEVNIGGEESKSGVCPDEVLPLMEEIAAMPNVFVCGLMAIPPICNRPEENRKYFSKMRQMFLDIRAKKMDNSSMEILSMGMSDDFAVAIEEGATLVRVGTALFGKRNYN